MAHGIAKDPAPLKPTRTWQKVSRDDDDDVSRLSRPRSAAVLPIVPKGAVDSHAGF